MTGNNEAKPISGDDTRSPRRINWIRISAAVLTSKLFFLASCTGGMVLSHFAFDGIESGIHGDHLRALDERMSVIALIPNADKPGERKVVQTPLGSLARFKQDNPNCSFMPPLGKGEVNDPSLYTRTEYTVTTAGPGKVMVETKFHDDEHHVLARYAATDKEIKPLYTKTNHDFVDFMIGMFFVGFPLALVLALVGYIFKWRLQRMEGARNSEAVIWHWQTWPFDRINVYVVFHCLCGGNCFLEAWFGLILLLPAFRTNLPESLRLNVHFGSQVAIDCFVSGVIGVRGFLPTSLSGQSR